MSRATHALFSNGTLSLNPDIVPVVKNLYPQRPADDPHPAQPEVDTAAVPNINVEELVNLIIGKSRHLARDQDGWSYGALQKLLA